MIDFLFQNFSRNIQLCFLRLGLINKNYLSGILGDAPDDLDMSSVEKFRSHYDKKCSINTAYPVPHGAIRLEVLGFNDRPLVGEDMKKAKKILYKSLEEGAVGLATGMSYYPNAWSDTKELIELCEVVSDSSKVYVTHLRDRNTERGYKGGGILEALEIGKQSKVKVHFSHHRTNASNAGVGKGNACRTCGRIGGAWGILMGMPPWGTSEGAVS